MSIYKTLKDKIAKKKIIITVMGLGYVGLPIAVEFSRKGFTVNGFDTNAGRIKKLKKGISYIKDIGNEEIKDILKKKNFYATSNKKVLSSADVIIICVPTPLRKIKIPDISYIIHASRLINKHMRKGQLIILESTTYPGTTREIILPELERSGYKREKDFYLAFSPERIDPGNKKYDFTNIPKVIGGFTERSTKLCEKLYRHVVKKTFGVSTPETAEVTKLLENTFRIVNIGLINEFSNLCNKLNIDVWEVIEAAQTKPFGFMPFFPGPGIGGHCIPADPVYLSWKAKKIGFETKMIDLAARVNRNVPNHIVKRIGATLKERRRKIKNAKIFIIGVTYKKDVNDLRESPALDIIEKLEKKKAIVSYHDPYIPYLSINGIRAKSKKITKTFLKKQDLAVIVTDHSGLDYNMIAEHTPVIFDTRNIFHKKGIKSKNIIKL